MNFFSIKLLLFSYQLIFTFVLGAQKNCLIETVLLSTIYICFGREISKTIPVRTLICRSAYFGLGSFCIDSANLRTNIKPCCNPFFFSLISFILFKVENKYKSEYVHM